MTSKERMTKIVFDILSTPQPRIWKGSLPHVPINVPPPASAKPAGSALPENIKAAAGASKLPLHLIPPAFKAHLALAMAFGAKKYGEFNWRGTEAKPIRASVYVAAMHRHLDAWASGEDVADDSGVDHLAHLAASCAIIIDAKAAGRFKDDRHHLDLEADRAAAEATIARWQS